ncbi:PREDICTED: uncharacterized protein LOC106297601 [Brassica oleracea var. oleracea]|uniref:uncharacterized protein LOC106297601 n=1 Tax=Brassica oleracea var. oleracea TaxID=109376 RepID=UPI0006A7200E|nr:PREDICTED: uncharacterized protein LOC106297601 [Brassica oleracea var. oleracea]
MAKAVCNHGFFMMAPNVWDPKSKSLTRPLTLSNSSSVSVTISHPRTLSFLVIQVHGINNVSRVDEELILQQVGRMLRISAQDDRDVTEFQQLHENAKKNGFGRIFGSLLLFEDMVKFILLCNNTWERTLGMASSLCILQSKLVDGTKLHAVPAAEIPGFQAASDLQIIPSSRGRKCVIGLGQWIGGFSWAFCHSLPPVIALIKVSSIVKNRS